MTLESVAALIGSKANTISGWETGSRQVGLDDLKKLAEAYGCHPAALLFAPPGGEDFERMKAASEMLANMTAEAADEWLAIGRRITRSEKTVE